MAETAATNCHTEGRQAYRPSSGSSSQGQVGCFLEPQLHSTFSAPDFSIPINAEGQGLTGDLGPSQGRSGSKGHPAT